MSLTLYAPPHNPRAAKVQIVAQHLNIPLAEKTVPYTELKSEWYLKVNPAGKVPALQTPEGVIAESCAIIRYLARKAGALYGKNPFEVAQIDQWLDFHNTQIDMPSVTILVNVAGWFPTTKEKYNDVKRSLKESLKTLDNHLKGKKYLVGDELSIADIAICSMLVHPYRLVLDEAARKTLPAVTEWFVSVTSLPAFVNISGKAWLCQKEFEVHFGEEKKPEEKKEEKAEEKKPKEPKEAKEGKKEGGQKKAEKKKEEPKKEAKKPEKKKKDEESEEDDGRDPTYQQPKKKNPLDALPPSPFKLDDFKREISNNPDRQAVLNDFWTKYDPAGWSLWKVTYQKYEGEGVVDYTTANLMSGFIRNLDHFRKYAFAGYGVYGVPGSYDIKGAWMWRGTEIPAEWKEHQSFEYHNFQRLDHSNQAHRKLIEEYWIKTKQGEQVEGLPIYEAKHFK